MTQPSISTRRQLAAREILIGLAVGFASFALRLVRLGREMQRKTMNEAEETDESASESER